MKGTDVWARELPGIVGMPTVAAVDGSLMNPAGVPVIPISRMSPTGQRTAVYEDQVPLASQTPILRGTKVAIFASALWRSCLSQPMVVGTCNIGRHL